MFLSVDIWAGLLRELDNFFQIEFLLRMIRSGDYSALRTVGGLESVLLPAIPLLLLIEIIRSVVYRKFRVVDYKVPFITYVFNRLASQFITISAVSFCIVTFQKNRFFSTSLTWYWFIYGFVIFQLAHYIYHYLAHKIRILWCLHAPHHAPETMNLSVAYTHFILETSYADFVKTGLCVLLGVNPAFIFFSMFIDGMWAGFLHVGENVLKDGRLGFLNKVLLTPSHHRVHHAKNPLYLDTNFCNTLNIWDKLFGTLQDELRDIKLEYGITRKMDPTSFWDLYFGEIIELARDVYNAPGVKTKLLYLIMPPGWNHEGKHKTVHVIREEYLKGDNN